MASKGRTFILFGLVIGGLFVLASSLGSLSLQPGRQFSIQNAAVEAGVAALHPVSDLWILFFRGLMILLLIACGIAFIYMAIDPQRRKGLILNLLGAAVLIGMLMLLQQYIKNRALPEQEEETILLNQPQVNFEDMEGGEEVSFDPSTERDLTGIAVIGVAAVFIILAGYAWWEWKRNKPKQFQELEKLAVEAEETLESLLDGADFNQTIRICYQRMTEVVRKTRSIHREAATTPHEFELQLMEHGIPGAAVHDLTSIFEEVRYGTTPGDEWIRQRAINALQGIIIFCRETQESPA